MSSSVTLEILPQPDDTTCGPTCLHAVYRYYGDQVSLDQVVSEVPSLEEGGTLAVFLACHALLRGYGATIYTYNLQVFDPTWFADPATDLAGKLRAQLSHKSDARTSLATSGYLSFLELGGVIRFEDLSRSLIRNFLTSSRPILTGLSATYLYRTAREYGPSSDEDDVRGLPQGHFVVLFDYDRQERQVMVADPHAPNAFGASSIYSIGIDRVLGAIFLGVLTHDANLLIIEPSERHRPGKGP